MPSHCLQLITGGCGWLEWRLFHSVRIGWVRLDYIRVEVMSILSNFFDWKSVKSVFKFLSNQCSISCPCFYLSTNSPRQPLYHGMLTKYQVGRYPLPINHTCLRNSYPTQQIQSFLAYIPAFSWRVVSRDSSKPP